VAETKRASADQPITRHPLFPAIAALWLGALFGLGSLAIGPAVIERIVLATGIDKVIPMAAPPLGTTTRILLALVLTALGAGIGVVIARRIAARADAPHSEATPLDASETAADAPAASADAPRRRRGLTAKVDDTAPVFSEHAPLPGHDPQILNVAEFDLDGFEDAFEAASQDTAHDTATPAPAPFRPRIVTPLVSEDTEAALPAWLDAESAWREPPVASIPGAYETPAPVGAQVFRSVLDEAMQAEPEDAVPATGPSSLFETYSRELAPHAQTHDAGHDDAADAFTAPAATFTAAPASTCEQTEEPGFRLLPRLPHGDWNAQLPDEPAAQEFVSEPAFEPSPVFEAQVWPETHDKDEDPAPQPFVETTADDFAPDHASEPLAEQVVEPEPAPFSAPLVAHEDAAPHEASSAAQRIAEADLDYLSPVELLERLALAMAARREAARIAATAPAPFAAPVSMVDEVSAATDEAEHVVSTVADFAPPPPAVPIALRPFAFDHDFDQDDESLGGYVPPRSIGLAASRDQSPDDRAFDPDASIDSIPFPRSPFAQAEPAFAQAFDDSAIGGFDDEAEPALAQGYASLLNLSRGAGARRHVVRFDPIEEEDEVEASATQQEEADAHETSVILPRETNEASPFTRPVLAPAPELHDDETDDAAQRPFDAPGRGEADQTERALRAALATLQRMSGAA
jgi:hypothetical protein